MYKRQAQVYPSFKDKKDMPVTKKKRETRPSQKNLNDKNARRYLIRLANINFGKGDISVSYTHLDVYKRQARNLT